MPALDGIDRVRMLELNLQNVLDDAAAAVEGATHDAADVLARVLHLWQPRDTTQEAARSTRTSIRTKQFPATTMPARCTKCSM